MGARDRRIRGGNGRFPRSAHTASASKDGREHSLRRVAVVALQNSAQAASALDLARIEWDDVRAIDWRLTAATRSAPHLVKRSVRFGANETDSELLTPFPPATYVVHPHRDHL